MSAYERITTQIRELEQTNPKSIMISILREQLATLPKPAHLVAAEKEQQLRARAIELAQYRKDVRVSLRTGNVSRMIELFDTALAELDTALAAERARA
jgi:hypothetical protein